MSLHIRWSGFSLAFVAAASLTFVGCGKGDDKDKQAKATTTTTTTTTGKDDHSAKAKDIHRGAWCEEHGVWEVGKHSVKEKTCSLCMSEEQQEKIFKSKKDWCDIHERAKSQCYKCDPKLYDGFAAEYKKKFGVDPPRPPDEEFQDEKKKG